jgi:hypothetical protein
MENRILRLELAMLLSEARSTMNKNVLNRAARESAHIAQRLGTLNSAMIAAIIRDLEVESRKFKKKGRFMIKNEG